MWWLMFWITSCNNINNIHVGVTNIRNLLMSFESRMTVMMTMITEFSGCCHGNRAQSELIRMIFGFVFRRNITIIVIIIITTASSFSLLRPSSSLHQFGAVLQLSDNNCYEYLLFRRWRWGWRWRRRWWWWEYLLEMRRWCKGHH